MSNIKSKADGDKPKNKGCLAGCLILLMIFLVGAGSCVGLMVFLDSNKDKISEDEKKFLHETKDKVDNKQATGFDLYVFAHMVRSYKTRQEIGLTELDMTYEIDEMYVSYLQQAMDKNIQEAKLDYATFIFERNRDVFDNGLSEEIKKITYLELKQSIELTEEVFNTQCKVYQKPDYREFHSFPKEVVPARSYLLGWFDRESIKTNYPELYDLAQKAEETYQKNCKKNKP